MSAIKKQSKKSNGKKPTVPAKKKAPVKQAGKNTPAKKQPSKMAQTSRSSKQQAKALQEQRVLVEVIIKTHDDIKGGHPHVMIDEIENENKNVSVGLTTRKFKGKDHPNIKLEKDPLNKTDESYMRRTGTVDDKINYHTPKRGTMTINDYNKAQKIAKSAKSGHLAKRNKKK